MPVSHVLLGWSSRRLGERWRFRIHSPLRRRSFPPTGLAPFSDAGRQRPGQHTLVHWLPVMFVSLLRVLGSLHQTSRSGLWRGPAEQHPRRRAGCCSNSQLRLVLLSWASQMHYQLFPRLKPQLINWSLILQDFCRPHPNLTHSTEQKSLIGFHLQHLLLAFMTYCLIWNLEILIN